MGIQYHKVASSLPAAVPDGTLLDHVLVDQYNRPIGASVPVDSTGTPLGTLANPLRNQQVGISTAQIVDALGNGVTVTNNKLDVNANATVAGSVALTNSTAEIGNVKNSGTFAVQAASAIAEGADITQGSKADARNAATDTTAITVMAVLKQLSYMLQNPACGFTMHHGLKATASDNVGVALMASTTPARDIVIQPLAGNSGPVYIGGTGVTPSTGGTVLNAGDSVHVNACDVATIFVVAAAHPDGVQFSYCA